LVIGGDRSVRGINFLGWQAELRVAEKVH